MARPIEGRFSAVVLLGASVCLGKGGTPIDGTGATRTAVISQSRTMAPRESRWSKLRQGQSHPAGPCACEAEGPAGLIVLAGRVWTGDPANPWVEGVAARDGAIVKVGSREDVLCFKHPRTIVIDRPGSFAIPGLIDAHGHVESLGASLERVDLRGVSSLDEVARRVQARLESVPGDSWITGGSWDQSLWPGGAFPTAAVLDAVAPGRPVWLSRVDGHAGWANSEAMRKAGVGRQTVAPADGQILRDPAGQPTGIFVDGAMGLVARVVPPSKPDDLKRRILAAQRQILAAGLTGVHDAGITPAEAQVYRDLDRSGQLRLRVYAMATPPAGHEVEFVSRPPRKATPAERFELRAVKVFIDGAMGSRGALLFQPYHDDPASKGLLLIDPKVLEATTVAALRNHWQVATHAIGDRGNALVLDAYAAALKAVPEAHDARLRIEHAQVIRREDVRRFAELGIITSMQPSHASDDMRWADARLGAGASTGPMPGAGFAMRRSRWRSAAIFRSRSSIPSGASMRQSLDRMPRENPRAAGIRSSGCLWKRLSADSRLGQRTQPSRKTDWECSGLACRPT